MWVWSSVISSCQKLGILSHLSYHCRILHIDEHCKSNGHYHTIHVLWILEEKWSIFFDVTIGRACTFSILKYLLVIFWNKTIIWKTHTSFVFQEIFSTANICYSRQDILKSHTASASASVGNIKIQELRAKKKKFNMKCHAVNCYSDCWNILTHDQLVNFSFNFLLYIYWYSLITPLRTAFH